MISAGISYSAGPPTVVLPLAGWIHECAHLKHAKPHSVIRRVLCPVRLTSKIVCPFTTPGVFRYPSEITDNEPFAPLHSLRTHDPLGSGAETKGVLLKKPDRAAQLTFAPALHLEALRRLEGATG